MTFTTELNNNTSERETYVSVQPRRHVIDDLQFVSGNVYSMYWEHPVTNVQYQDTTYVEESSFTATPAISKWSWNPTTKYLYIGISGSLDEEDHFIDYVLGFKTGNSKTTNYNLDDMASPNIKWESRLKTVPRLTESMKNILSGVISTTSSPLNIINQDRKYNKLFTVNDSWEKSETKIWVSVNGVTKKMFTGLTSSPTISNGNISMPLRTKLVKLNETNTMGDSLSESQATETGDLIPSLTPRYRPEDIGKPIPYIIGNNEISVSQANCFLPLDSEQPMITTFNTVSGSMNKATCYSVADGQNLGWVLGRTAASLPIHSMTSISSVTMVKPTSATDLEAYTVRYRDPSFDATNGAFTNFKRRVVIQIVCSSHNMEIGDSFTMTFSGAPQGVGGTYNYVVVKITGNTIQALSGDMDNYGAYTTGFNFSSYVTNVTNRKAMGVTLVQGGKKIPLIAEFDYVTRVNTLTPSGHKIHRILLNGNLKFDMQLKDITPETTEILFRISTARTNEDHEKIIEKVITSSGLSVDSASITQAGIDLSSSFNISIPYKGRENETYRDTLEQMLKSTIGYVTPDAEGVVKYSVFNTPSTFDYTITEKDIVLNTFKVTVGYSDIKSTLIMKNTHNYSSVVGNVISVNKEDVTSNTLYNIDRIEDFNHSLSSVSDTRLDDIYNLSKSRRVVYQFRVSHKYLEAVIGDKIKIVHDDVLNESGEVLAVITKISKSETSVTIEATDFQTIG